MVVVITLFSMLSIVELNRENILLGISVIIPPCPFGLADLASLVLSTTLKTPEILVVFFLCITAKRTGPGTLHFCLTVTSTPQLPGKFVKSMVLDFFPPCSTLPYGIPFLVKLN